MPGQLFKSYEFGVAKATFSWNIQKTNTCFSSAFSVLVWKKLFFGLQNVSKFCFFAIQGIKTTKGFEIMYRISS
jgi:hypothetical protein